MGSETCCLWFCDPSLFRKEQFCKCTVETAWLSEKRASDESSFTFIAVKVGSDRKFKNAWTICHNSIKKPVI